jgi:hypothetical protein
MIIENEIHRSWMRKYGPKRDDHDHHWTASSLDFEMMGNKTAKPKQSVFWDYISNIIVVIKHME